MKKVLIISSPFYDYQISVGRAFEDLGYEVKIETYDEPINPFKGWIKWRHKFAINKENLRQKSRIKYNNYIIDVYDHYHPAIVFSYNGTILFDETLDYFRLKSKVIIWMYDSVQRKDRERCKAHIDHCDGCFCFEKSDVDYYKSMGKTAYFLPLACDTHIYYPIQNIKDIDILFVGTIYTSKRRIRLLKNVVNQFPNAKILIYGHYKPFYKNPIKWLFREKRNIFKNVNLPPNKVNELFSHTKIALNIHHEQSLNGANQRVFEACGSCAYQICDANPYIESIFPNGEVGLYHNDEEMITLIRKALKSENAANAYKAYNTVIKNHTFVKRIEQMLEIVNKQ